MARLTHVAGCYQFSERISDPPHSPRLIRRAVFDREPSFLDLAGIPLGLFPESQYHEIELLLDSGDVLVFYSDGIVESRNEAGEEFGLKRLAEAVRNNAAKSADEIVSVVDKFVDAFVGRAAASDDRTMIVVKMQ